MDGFYKVRAERQPARHLTLAYPTRETALAAAEVIGPLWEQITVWGPDGAVLFKSERAPLVRPSSA